MLGHISVVKHVVEFVVAEIVGNLVVVECDFVLVPVV